MNFGCASNGYHGRAPWRTLACEQRFLGANFRFWSSDFTRVTLPSIHDVQKVSISLLAMQTGSPESWVHHTSISCNLDGYFDFSKKLNFQIFSEKSAFFGIFRNFCPKIPKRPQLGLFWKNSMLLKMLQKHSNLLKKGRVKSRWKLLSCFSHCRSPLTHQTHLL